MNFQRGSIYPLIAVGGILVIIVGFFFFSKTQKFNETFSDPNQLSTIPTSATKENSTSPCKKSVEENRGSCELGTILVRVHRRMSKNELAELLKKHNLTIKHDLNTNDSTGYIRISFYDRTDFLTNQEWEEKLKDPSVKDIKVSNTVGDNSKYIIVQLAADTTDQAIKDYIERKQLNDFIDYDLFFSLGKEYYVQVPEGTEFEWDKIKDESTDILKISQYYPSYGISLD